MQTTHTTGGHEYVLSNEGVIAGDLVWPISTGRVNADGSYSHAEFNFRDFPEDPHLMVDLTHSDYKPYEARTDHGFGPVEKYFKIVERKPLLGTSAEHRIRAIARDVQAIEGYSHSTAFLDGAEAALRHVWAHIPPQS